jgi:hypothetical protein
MVAGVRRSVHIAAVTRGLAWDLCSFPALKRRAIGRAPLQCRWSRPWRDSRQK